MPKAIITYRWNKRPNEQGITKLTLDIGDITIGYIEGVPGKYEAFTCIRTGGYAKKKINYKDFRTQKEAKRYCEEYHGFCKLKMSVVYGSPRMEYC